MNNDFEDVIKGVNHNREAVIQERLGEGEFHKGHPTGYINKYGKQKQGDGTWKYVGKGGNVKRPAKAKAASGENKPVESKKEKFPIGTTVRGKSSTGGEISGKVVGHKPGHVLVDIGNTKPAPLSLSNVAKTSEKKTTTPSKKKSSGSKMKTSLEAPTSAPGKKALGVLMDKNATYADANAAVKVLEKKIKDIEKTPTGQSDKQLDEKSRLNAVLRNLKRRATYSTSKIKNMSNAHYQRTFLKGEGDEMTKDEAYEILGLKS